MWGPKNRQVACASARQACALTIQKGLLWWQGCAQDALPQVIQAPACEVLHNALVQVVEQAVDGEVPAAGAHASSQLTQLGDLCWTLPVAALVIPQSSSVQLLVFRPLCNQEKTPVAWEAMGMRATCCAVQLCLAAKLCPLLAAWWWSDFAAFCAPA